MLKELLLMKWRPGKILNTPEGLSISPSFPLTTNLRLLSCVTNEKYNEQIMF